MGSPLRDMRNEEKRISQLDMIQLQNTKKPGDSRKDLTAGFESVREAIATHYSSWLLGGETYQWSIHKDIGTGDFVLNRW